MDREDGDGDIEVVVLIVHARESSKASHDQPRSDQISLRLLHPSTTLQHSEPITHVYPSGRPSSGSLSSSICTGRSPCENSLNIAIVWWIAYREG